MKVASRGLDVVASLERIEVRAELLRLAVPFEEILHLHVHVAGMLAEGFCQVHESPGAAGVGPLREPVAALPVVDELGRVVVLVDAVVAEPVLDDLRVAVRFAGEVAHDRGDMHVV